MIGGAVAPYMSYDDGLAGQLPVPLQSVRRGNSMLYSSGTTGLPKGVRVELSDEAPEQPPKRYPYLVSEYGLGTDTVFLNPGPFYHVAPAQADDVRANVPEARLSGLRSLMPKRVCVR